MLPFTLRLETPKVARGNGSVVLYIDPKRFVQDGRASYAVIDDKDKVLAVGSIAYDNNGTVCDASFVTGSIWDHDTGCRFSPLIPPEHNVVKMAIKACFTTVEEKIKKEEKKRLYSDFF